MATESIPKDPSVTISTPGPQGTAESSGGATFSDRRVRQAERPPELGPHDIGDAITRVTGDLWDRGCSIL